MTWAYFQVWVDLKMAVFQWEAHDGTAAVNEGIWGLFKANKAFSLFFKDYFYGILPFLDIGAVKTDRKVEWEREGHTELKWRSTFSSLLLANKTITIKPLATRGVANKKTPKNNNPKNKTLVRDQIKQPISTFFFSFFLPKSVILFQTCLHLKTHRAQKHSNLCNRK